MAFKTALHAPLALKAPVFWRFSHLKNNFRPELNQRVSLVQKIRYIPNIKYRDCQKKATETLGFVNSVLATSGHVGVFRVHAT